MKMNPEPYYIVIDESHRPLVHRVDNMTMVAHTTRASAEALAVEARILQPAGVTGELTVMEIWFTLDKPEPVPAPEMIDEWWD